MIVWRDGDYVDARSAISPEDRGWLVGDAIFETVLVEEGRPAFLARHLSRLKAGLSAMRMSYVADEGRIREAIGELAARNAVASAAAFRLTISRVGGGRGLSFDPGAPLQATAVLKKTAPPPAQWRAVVSTRRRWTGALTNGFKCVGAYSENLLARIEANAQDADEAIMLNEHGRVACASAANVFVATQGGLVTPSVEEGALPGVVRSVVAQEARRMGISVTEGEVDLAMLAGAPLLLTNSIAGVVKASVGAAPRIGFEIADACGRAYRARLLEEISGRDQGAGA